MARPLSWLGWPRSGLPLPPPSLIHHHVPIVAGCEAPFMCVSSCKPPRHPDREGTVIVHFLSEGQESPHPRPGIRMRWQIQERSRQHVGLVLEVPVSGSWHAVGRVYTAQPWWVPVTEECTGHSCTAHMSAQDSSCFQWLTQLGGAQENVRGPLSSGLDSWFCSLPSG